MNDGVRASLHRDSFLEDTHKKRSTTVTPDSDNLYNLSDHMQMGKSLKSRVPKLHLSLNHPKLIITSSSSSRKASADEVCNADSQNKSIHMGQVDEDHLGINMSHLAPVHAELNPLLMIKNLKVFEPKNDDQKKRSSELKLDIKKLHLLLRKETPPEFDLSPGSMHHSNHKAPLQRATASPGRAPVHDSSTTNKQIKDLILIKARQKENSSSFSGSEKAATFYPFAKRNTKELDLVKLIKREEINEEKLKEITQKKQSKMFFRMSGSMIPERLANQSRDSIGEEIDEQIKANQMSAKFIEISCSNSPLKYVTSVEHKDKIPFSRGITLGDNPSPDKPKVLKKSKDSSDMVMEQHSIEKTEPMSAGFDKKRLNSKKSIRKGAANKNTIYGGVAHYLKSLPLVGAINDDQNFGDSPIEQNKPLSTQLEFLYGKAYPSMVTYVSFTGDDHLLARVDTSNGNLLAIYQGDLHEGMPCGKGVLKYSADEYYSGEWLGGLAHGDGELITRGYEYRGVFIDGIFDGHGELKIKGKGTYDGRFYGGKFHGRGKFTWVNGNQIYLGNWRNGLFHGKGLIVWSDGRKFYGKYYKGQKNGKGLCIFASGAHRYGNWSLGEFLGYIN
jgi:hypothetical protein